MSLVPDHLQKKYEHATSGKRQEDEAPKIVRAGGKLAFLRHKLFVALFSVILLFVLGALAMMVWVSDRQSEFLQNAQPGFGRTITTEQGELFLQDFGIATATPAVLIHGFGAWSEVWRPTLELMSKDGWRAVAPDMPPFGYTERPFDQNYSRAEQAELLDLMMARLELEEAVVIAHSSGARAGVELAMAYPERVRGLVLINPVLGNVFEGRVERGNPVMRLLLSNPTIRHVVMANSYTNPLMTKFLLRRFTARDEMVDDRVAQLYQRPLTLQGTTDAFGYWAYLYVSGADTGLSLQRSQYQSLDIPVIMIWGEADPHAPPGDAFALQNMLSSSTVITLKGVGHLPHLEDQSRFHSALKTALSLIPE